MESHIHEIKAILDSSKGEREIHSYLKKHPRLIAETFCPRHSTGRVVSEFSLGDEYRADFLAGVPMSGGWFVYLIELEPVDAPLFTKDLNTSKHLNTAFSQLRSWRIFEEKNRAYLVKQIANAFRENDLYDPNRDDPEPYCSAGMLMTDERCIVGILHKVMIGRRASLSKDELTHKAMFMKTIDVEVRTYDHLLDHAGYFQDDDW